ncbi:hypothetical protein [Dyella mobilis]|uniref:DUF5056 domain-containing protein n=1 Tax=Dyella mobilis TaxID=1849582 RepID=A0ABS2KDE2_9GAMM|nr:hypothetical protein [Dyella mobilis]MBM7128908.1 hypothetical protein [Dyella mobilis]GLQ99402.1 hypothetical protein GCM10007863_38220 [Dyella mobilis]
MSKRRAESFSANDEQRWEAQERTLRALHDRVTPASDSERVHVDDTSIFDALSQWPAPALPANFVAAVTAASESLQERRRQVKKFRRAVFGGLTLVYAVVAGAGLSMAGGANLEIAALVARHDLNQAPWLAAALVAAALIAILGGNADRQHDLSH